MAVHKDASRLEWFMAAWAEQRRRAAKLLGRITDLGSLQAMTPATLRKFLKLMDQVCEAKQEETKIISNIDAIEAQHRFRRVHKLLRHASPQIDRPAPGPAYDAEAEGPKRQWTWALFLWYLLMTRRINQKNHRLTVD